jgi:GTP-binding protein
VKPIVALVGRPNVGKSTLFNRLTRRRNAIVVDVPGVTRDRHYGEGRVGVRPFIVIDTGGLEPGAKTGIFAEMGRQAEQAMAEADAVVFLTDGRAGLHADDREIAARLRKLGARVWLVANKCEGMASDAAVAEFYALGLGQPNAISAAHGEGVGDLIEGVLAEFTAAAEDGDEARDKHPRVAVVGRPNVGK